MYFLQPQPQSQVLRVHPSGGANRYAINWIGVCEVFRGMLRTRLSVRPYVPPSGLMFWYRFFLGKRLCGIERVVFKMNANEISGIWTTKKVYLLIYLFLGYIKIFRWILIYTYFSISNWYTRIWGISNEYTWIWGISKIKPGIWYIKKHQHEKGSKKYPF